MKRYWWCWHWNEPQWNGFIARTYWWWPFRPLLTVFYITRGPMTEKEIKDLEVVMYDLQKLFRKEKDES